MEPNIAAYVALFRSPGELCRVSPQVGNFRIISVAPCRHIVNATRSGTKLSLFRHREE